MASRPMLLYPRLAMHVGRQLIAEQAGLSVPALASRSETSHPEQVWIPTGGTRVSTGRLFEIRETVRTLAEEHGYPGATGARGRTAFDRECGAQLFRMMNIVPADAASDGVWTSMTCLVLPDVATWRFPDRNEERLLGTPRNTFRRLWWRVYVLDGGRSAADDVSVVDQLGEDEVVQVMERPALAGNPRLARRVCLMFLDVARRSRGVPRMELMRDAAKRLIRLTPFVALDALGDDALDEVFEAAFEESARALSAG